MLRSFARTCVLLFVSEAPAHGYELVERLQALGVNASDPGTVYRSLHCLEEQGFLRSQWVPSDQGGPDRRVYMITGRGIEALHADADALRRDERALNAFLASYESLYQRPPLSAAGRRQAPSSAAATTGRLAATERRRVVEPPAARRR